MINVTAIYNEADEACGFRVEGHAGYEDAGRDIVCAAVSVLAENTVNSVETFTEDHFSCKTDEKSGLLEFIITSDVSKESKLLLQSFFLGIRTISEEYNKHVKFKFHGR